MVNVIHTKRKSAVLTPSALACLSRTPTVNLTAGCAHGCVYCYTRGFSQHPGEGNVLFYSNTFEKIKDELTRKRKKPKAVYFSPASDLFQPVPQVLDLAYDILSFLFEAQVGVALLTKGVIPRRHMELLQANATFVRAQIGISMLDEGLTRMLEPHAAPPKVRLAQMKQLIVSGIPSQARLDPIFPGLGDDAGSLNALFVALAKTGVKQIAASTLFLRPAVIGSLKRHIPNTPLLSKLLGNFDACSRLGIHANNSSVIALSQQARKEVYARVQAAAARHGMTVRICACKNPDLSSQSCNIAGDWNDVSDQRTEPTLFD